MCITFKWNVFLLSYIPLYFYISFISIICYLSVNIWILFINTFTLSFTYTHGYKYWFLTTLQISNNCVNIWRNKYKPLVSTALDLSFTNYIYNYCLLLTFWNAFVLVYRPTHSVRYENAMFLWSLGGVFNTIPYPGGIWRYLIIHSRPLHSGWSAGNAPRRHSHQSPLICTGN